MQESTLCCTMTVCRRSSHLLFSRFPHPLVVAHATALFEANHRSVNEQLPGARQRDTGQLQQSKRARHKGVRVTPRVRLAMTGCTG
jgi:hypothetical protein